MKIREWLRNLRTRPPVISTQYGTVSESARKQATVNMNLDPLLQLRVEQMVIAECGGDITRGRAEFRRRYPEVNVPW